MQAWEDGDLCLGGSVRRPGAVSVPSPQMVLVPQSSHHWDVGFANGHHALEPGDVPRLIRRNLALMEWEDLSFAQDGVFQWFFLGGGWLGSGRDWFQTGSFETRTPGGDLWLVVRLPDGALGVTPAPLAAGVIPSRAPCSEVGHASEGLGTR